jgi:4-hydroxy-tetrahydrodipicolinate synthase
MDQLKGIVPALVTPFASNGSVDLSGMRRLICRMLDAHVHGLLLAGTVGEFYALTLDEKRDIFMAAVDEVGGRIPVVAGTGAVTTREAVQTTRVAAEAGVDAVAVLTPFFIRPSDQELFEHYRTIATSTRSPVFLYSNPSRTGVPLSTALVKRLAQIDNVAGIKDSSGDLTRTAEYISVAPQSFSVLAGCDSLIYATLCYGGQGAVSATAAVVPSLVMKIYDDFVRGAHAEARDAQRALLPLRRAFALGSFPQVLREALAMQGYDVGKARDPLGPLSSAEREELAGVLAGVADYYKGTASLRNLEVDWRQAVSTRALDAGSTEATAEDLPRSKRGK